MVKLGEILRFLIDAKASIPWTNMIAWFCAITELRIALFKKKKMCT